MSPVTYRVVDDSAPDFVVIEVRGGDEPGHLYRIPREPVEWPPNA